MANNVTLEDALKLVEKCGEWNTTSYPDYVICQIGGGLFGVGGLIVRIYKKSFFAKKSYKIEVMDDIDRVVFKLANQEEGYSTVDTIYKEAFEKHQKTKIEFEKKREEHLRKTSALPKIKLGDLHNIIEKGEKWDFFVPSNNYHYSGKPFLSCHVNDNIFDPDGLKINISREERFRRSSYEVTISGYTLEKVTFNLTNPREEVYSKVDKMFKEAAKKYKIEKENHLKNVLEKALNEILEKSK